MATPVQTCVLLLGVIISFVKALQSPCTSGSDFTVYKHPSDCTKYIQCDHSGSPIYRECPPSLHFNPSLSICDWPDSAKCTVTLDTTEKEPSNETPTPTPWPPSTISTTTPIATVTPSFPSHCPNPEKKRICYFNNWAFYRPEGGKFVPENVDAFLCTHILYAFAVLDENTWKIKEFDPWADLDNSFYSKIATGLKEKNPCSKTLIALGGWNDSKSPKYSIMMNDENKRKIFVTSAVDFCRKYKFDGMDLDIEYPASPWGVAGNLADKIGFTNLVRELHTEFKPHGLMITSAVSANPQVCERGYDVPALVPYLEWFGVMSYDYNGNWDGKTGPSAPLYSTEPDQLSCDVSIKWWLDAGCPPSKLLLGMPTYGQTFTLQDPTKCSLDGIKATAGKSGLYTRQDGILAYYEIKDIPSNIITSSFPSTNDTGPYFCYGENQLVSYDDPEFFQKKIDYVYEQNLGGFMAWDVTMDTFQPKYQHLGRHNELLQTIKKSISNSV